VLADEFTAMQDRAFDNTTDADALREDLLAIARTTLSSKILTHDKDHFATIAVDAVMCLKGRTNLEPIHIIKKSGGTLRDSFLAEVCASQQCSRGTCSQRLFLHFSWNSSSEEQNMNLSHPDCPPLQGFILDKKIGVGQKKQMENAKVLVANTPMDTDKIKMYGARVKTDSMTRVAEIEAAERAKMKAKCEAIIAQGINVFINRQLIYNYPEQIFTEAGVMSIEHAGVLPSAACACILHHPPDLLFAAQFADGRGTMPRLQPAHAALADILTHGGSVCRL
jgi:T-complex protein 1 subunit beta